MVEDKFIPMGYMPLKDLPNQKECPWPGCGCTPELRPWKTKNTLRWDDASVQPEYVEVLVPYCKSRNEPVLSEEIAYAELLGARAYMIHTPVLTGKLANRVRRVLGLTAPELAVLLNRPDVLVQEESEMTSPDYSFMLLGMVCRNISLMES